MHVCRCFCLPVINMHVSCKDSGLFQMLQLFISSTCHHRKEQLVSVVKTSVHVCVRVHPPQAVAGISAHPHKQSWSELWFFLFFSFHVLILSKRCMDTFHERHDHDAVAAHGELSHSEIRAPGACGSSHCFVLLRRKEKAEPSGRNDSN